MAVEKKHEVRAYYKDTRTIEERLGGLFSTTPVTVGVFLAFGLLTIFQPWVFHILLIVALLWWGTVAFDIDRQVLPLFLPQEANNTDYHSPKPGGRGGYKKSEGIFFLGNARDRRQEIWETAAFAKQHKLVFGTTGAGKSELLMGLFVNFLAVGSGVIYSDAKGATEQVLRFYNVARRFGRDDDFFSVNYLTGGTTVRAGGRDRLTNTSNPTAFSSAHQIIQIFSSFLPKSSGDNQIFQERAVAMISAVVPCLVDFRDLHAIPLSINSIREYVTSLNKILELALDEERRLSEKAKDSLHKYLASLPNFDVEEFLTGKATGKRGKAYPIHAEAGRMFGYASQYFLRALSSLSDTYGHIYFTVAGEVDYRDIVLNRRICVISLPALENSPQEIQNLAKINLSNIRGAIAVGLGSKVEGFRRDTIDNLPSKSDYPTGIILDEYGYQATEGFAITMAQARSLGFSITIAGQDLSNLEMGSKDEAEAIFGNAALITLNIRNVKNLGDRIRDTVGEVDVAVSDGAEKNHSGPLFGYMESKTTKVERRTRVTSHDLVSLETGEAFLYAGKGIGTIKYNPFAPVPDPVNWFEINRFLPIDLKDRSDDRLIAGAKTLDRIVLRRLQGDSRPREIAGMAEGLRRVFAEVSAGTGPLADRFTPDLLARVAARTVTRRDPFVPAEGSADFFNFNRPNGKFGQAPHAGSLFGDYPEGNEFSDVEANPYSSTPYPPVRDGGAELRHSMRRAGQRYLSDSDDELDLDDPSSSAELQEALQFMERGGRAPSLEDFEDPVFPAGRDDRTGSSAPAAELIVDSEFSPDYDEDRDGIGRPESHPTVLAKPSADDVATHPAIVQARQDLVYKPPADAPTGPVDTAHIRSAIGNIAKRAKGRAGSGTSAGDPPPGPPSPTGNS